MTDEQSHIARAAAALDDPGVTRETPQPAPVDQKALVEVIRSAIGKWESSRVGWAAEHSIADALLAAGLRLPGAVQPDETLAWAVVRKGASLDIHTLFDERPDPKTWHLPKDAEVIRVAIRVVEDEA